jgi:hypothetical protein
MNALGIGQIVNCGLEFDAEFDVDGAGSAGSGATHACLLRLSRKRLF